MFLVDNTGKIIETGAKFYVDKDGKYAELLPCTFYVDKDGKIAELLGEKEGLDYIIRGIRHYDSNQSSASISLSEVDDDLNIVRTVNLYNTKPDGWSRNTPTSKDQRYSAYAKFTYTTSASSITVSVFKWDGSSYKTVYTADLTNEVKSKLRAPSNYIYHNMLTCRLSPEGDKLFMPIVTTHKYNGNNYYFYYNIFIFDVTDSGLTYKTKFGEYSFSSPGKTGYHSGFSMQFTDDMSYIYLRMEPYYNNDSGNSSYSYRDILFYLQSDGTYGEIYSMRDMTRAREEGLLTPDGKFFISYYISSSSEEYMYSKAQVNCLKDGVIVGTYYGKSPGYYSNADAIWVSVLAGSYYFSESQILIQRRAVSGSNGSYRLHMYLLSDTAVTYLGGFLYTIYTSTSTDIDEYFQVKDISMNMEYALTTRGHAHTLYIDSIETDETGLITAIPRTKSTNLSGSYDYDYSSYGDMQGYFIGL